MWGWWEENLFQNVSIQGFCGSDGGIGSIRIIDQLQKGFSNGEEVILQPQVITGAYASQALHISCGPSHDILTSDSQTFSFSSYYIAMTQTSNTDQHSVAKLAS